MLWGVVGRVGDDGVCEGMFTEDGSFQSFEDFVNGDVKVVFNVVPFYFCSE